MNYKMCLNLWLVLWVGSFFPVDVTPEERVLRVLQRLGPLEPLAPKLLSHLPMDMSNPWLSAQIPSSSWWWLHEKPETKRRQNLASYNLNSFGLRYGKWDQDMTTKWILLTAIRQLYLLLSSDCILDYIRHCLICLLWKQLVAVYEDDWCQSYKIFYSYLINFIIKKLY